MILIDEDRVGEGANIAFPKLSSCAAGIAVLGNSLVGGHFTKDVKGDQQKTQKLVDRMIAQIAGRKVDSFLIIGFNANHNPVAMRDLMGITANSGVAKAYDIAKEKTGALGMKSGNYELYLFASAKGGSPDITFKRASKVDIDKGDGWFDKWKTYQGYDAQVDAKNLHGLRRHYVNL